MKYTFLYFTILFASFFYPLHAQYAPKDTIALEFEDRTNLPAKVTHIAKQENRLFAATANGIWRSDDNGQTWEKKFTRNVVALVASDSVVVAVTYQYWVVPNPSNGTQTSYHSYSLHVSRDGGENFTNKLTKQGFGSLFTSENYDFRHLLVKNDSTFFFYLTYSTWGDTDGIWIWSEDYGENWEESVSSGLYFDAVAVSNDTIWGVKKGTTFRGLTNGMPSFNWDIPNLGQGASKLATAFYKNGFLHVQYESGHVLRSSDGSFNWEAVPDLHEEELTSHPNGIFKITDDAVLRAENNVLTDWTSIWDFSSLPNTRSFFHEFFALDGISVAQTAGGFLYISLDEHATWQRHFGISTGGNYIANFHYFAGKYRVNAFDGSLLTSDDFYNWELPSSSNYLEIMEPAPQRQITHKAVHGDFFFAVAGSSKYLLRTVDGLMWETMGPDLSDFTGFVFQSFGDRLYLVATTHNNWRLFYSDDHFTTWIEKPIGQGFMSFVATSDNWLGVSNPENKLVRSQDEGTTWDTLLNGMEFQSISIKTDGTLLALSQENEAVIWQSMDKGDSWEQSGLPPRPIEPDKDKFNYYNFKNDILQLRHRRFDPSNYVEAEILLTGDDGASYTSIGLPPGVPASNLIFAEYKLFSLTAGQLWVADSVVENLLFSLYPKDTVVLQTPVCQGDIVDGIPITADTVLSSWVDGGNVFHWTVNQISVVQFFESQFTASTCEGWSYEWNGEFYNSSGQYEQTFQTLNGCDSIVTLFLDILPAGNFDLTTSLCEGESITINGMIYDEANPIGMEVFPKAAVNNCDSIVHIDLSFLPNYKTENNLELLVGDIFQGRQIFSDTVIIENLISVDGCDSIITTNISVLTSVKNFFKKEIDLNTYPNPTSSDFYIEFDLPNAMAMEINIVDLLGIKMTTVYENTFFQKGKHQLKINSASLTNGLHQIIFKTEKAIFAKTFVKI